MLLSTSFSNMIVNENLIIVPKKKKVLCFSHMKAHDLCFIDCFLWFQSISIFLRASMGKATSLD